MFVSRTLVNLKLTSEFGLCWWTGGAGTFLPMLKRLCIDVGSILCDDKIELLLPSFPVLEELNMADFPWTGLDETVSSATLTKLKLCATALKTLQNPKSISFDTPSLLFFGYSDLIAEDYPLVNMKNLFEARILFVLTQDQVRRVRAPNIDLLEDGDCVLQFGNVVKLMNGIRNVQALHLHYDTLEVLSLCRESMPVFNNVKTLGIRSHERRGWQAMPKNCPHLEFLRIQGLLHHVTDECGDACDCNYRKDKGRSLNSCPVKFIEIQGFRGTMKEMHMIEHFLDYFPCLKKMRIYIDENGPTQLRNDLEVSQLILEMIEDYKEMYKCNVKLLMSDNLHKKWTAQPSL